MKKPYELTFIVKIDPNEDAMNATVDQVKGWVEANDNGQVAKIDRWGRRRLAYEINGEREGFYVLFEANIDPEHIPEIERDMKLSGEVLRYLIIRPD